MNLNNEKNKVASQDEKECRRNRACWGGWGTGKWSGKDYETDLTKGRQIFIHLKIIP